MYWAVVGTWTAVEAVVGWTFTWSVKISRANTQEILRSSLCWLRAWVAGGYSWCGCEADILIGCRFTPSSRLVSSSTSPSLNQK